MGQPRPLYVYFRFFLQQINVKNVHPVNGAGIQNHNLSNMSRHPEPLDHGYCPILLLLLLDYAFKMKHLPMQHWSHM